MDEAQIKALIAAEVGSAFADADLFKPISDQLTQDVRTFMEQTNGPLIERLDQLEGAVTQPTPDKPASPDEPEADSPLAARLKALEAQVETAETERAAALKATEDSERGRSISKAVQGFSPLFPDTAEGVFTTGLGELTRNGDQWLTQDGKTLTEAADGFFQSDVGKHFLSPKTAEGSGAGKPDGTTTTATAKTPIEDVLMGAFL